MITETRRPTTTIKFPRVFARFYNLRGSFTWYLRPNCVKSSVPYASFWMVRVSSCLFIKRVLFTHNLNVVSVRPNTVKQSLVYLRVQLLLSSWCFNIAEDVKTNTFRWVLITCFCIGSTLLSNRSEKLDKKNFESFLGLFFLYYVSYFLVVYIYLQGASNF